MGSGAALPPDRRRAELRRGDGAGACWSASACVLTSGCSNELASTPCSSTWSSSCRCCSAVLVALLPQSEKGQIRAVTFIGMLVDFGLAVLASTCASTRRAPEFQLEYRAAAGSPTSGISYHVGVDGLAVCADAAHRVPRARWWCSPRWTFIEDRVKEFHLALLVLQTAMLGALASLDVLLFYVFFEAMLIPMYLLIGVWGSEERQKAAVKFFLYTLAGSLLMLVAILAVYFLAPARRRAQLRLRDHLQRAARRQPRARAPASPARRRAAPRSRRWRRRCTPTARGCSSPSRWRSRSRCRCSRCTPGCRTRTCRRRWPGSIDPRRRDAEDGDLRLLAFRHAAVPGGRAADAAALRGARRWWASSTAR